MSNLIADYSQDITQNAIILIDDEPLSQDCFAEAMRGAFPQTSVVGILKIEDLYRPSGMAVEAVLLKTKPQSIEPHELAKNVRAIGRLFPETPVVIISAGDDAASIEAVIAAGAQGVIPVSASFKIAVAALRLVLAGGTYYPRPVIEKIDLSSSALEIMHDNAGPLPSGALPTSSLRMDVHPAPSPVVDEAGCFSTTFTAREVDVLTALQKGRSNKWIAHHLNLSENTIKVHIRHIMRKLRATNRTEAVILSQSMLPQLNRD